MFLNSPPPKIWVFLGVRTGLCAISNIIHTSPYLLLRVNDLADKLGWGLAPKPLVTVVFSTREYSY